MPDASDTVTAEGRAATIAEFFDDTAGSRLRSFVAIVIVALVAFLPGFSTIAPLDRDEPQYVIETRSVLETGDFATGGAATLWTFFRPAGVNWLQLASVSLFGDGAESPIWIYRLPSLIAAIVLALLTWWMALAFGRPRAALFAAILLVTTPLVAAEARLAKADTVMLAAIVLAQGALARSWRGTTNTPDYRNAFLFWLGLTVGVLTKGWIAPIVVGLTIAVLSASAGSLDWLKRLAPAAGATCLALVLVISGVMAVRLGGEGSLTPNIAVQETYQAPPGIYAVLFYPLFGPAAVFVALAIPGMIERIGRPVFLFAVAWVAPFWIIVELWPEKLPYYILPTFPALALIGATAIDEGWVRITGWVSTYFSLNLLVWPIFVGLGAVILFFVGEDRLPFAALPFFVVAILAGSFAFIWFYRDISLLGSAVLSLFSAILLYVGLFGGVFGKATALDVSRRVVVEGTSAATCREPSFASTGYYEPSLVFFAGNSINFSSPEEAADFLSEGGCRVVFVEGRRQSLFNQRAEDIGLELNVKEEVSGYDIGNWKPVKMRIFASEEPSR